MTIAALPATRRALDKRIAHLAFPALGALIAEPLFLLLDTAMVGHLGVNALASLAIASAILQTTVGLMVFLAYSTTPLVARCVGAGDLRGALQSGIAGMWIAIAIGALTALGLAAAAWPLSGAFNVAAALRGPATTYVLISSAGIPAMLLVFAASGVLRGLQDTRTPLLVAGLGFALNGVLNWCFIYGFGLGLAGSAIGTVLAQWAMVAAYVLVLARHCRGTGARFWPTRAGLGQTGRSGWWMFLRSVGLRVAILATVAATLTHGAVVAAGFQLVFTVVSTTAFALDALAIAAQALVGVALGAGDFSGVRRVMRRTAFWGLVFGGGVGLILAAASPLVARIFSSDPQLLAMLPVALVLLGVAQPLAGYVFVLDGVLMGAGDARYLAGAGAVNLLLYLPVVWGLAHTSGQALTRVFPGSAPAATLAAFTAAYALVFMGARALTLGWRARSARWIN